MGGRRREPDGTEWQELSGSFRRKLTEVMCVGGGLKKEKKGSAQDRRWTDS